jgi:D-alanyl-D-alanine carboxypeptidase
MPFLEQLVLGQARRLRSGSVTPAHRIAAALALGLVGLSVPAALAQADAPPRFVGTVSAVTRADLPYSWRPGCPVGPTQLRLLRLRYWGFDRKAHVGSLVVNASAARDVMSAFRTLYARRFPIRRMQTIDAFRGRDSASTAADNTSGFNCRYAVAAGPPRWSQHAFGLAIDVNPVENPYILGGRARPASGAAYLDRSRYRRGMAVPGGVVVRAFAAIGWEWGGRWASPDYQHFSANGR